MSPGLIVLKSELSMGTPSRMKSGEVPELIEFVPRIWKTAALLGSPELEMTDRPGAWPCSAWSKAAVGVSANFSALTVETEPVMEPFLRTP